MNFREADKFVYHPHLEVNEPEAIEFLKDMEAAGFHVPNAEEIVRTRTYTYPVHHEFFGAKPHRDWMFGNLFLVRMLDEFPGMIDDYITLKRAMPEAIPFQLLQWVHETRFSLRDRYGNGHSVFNYWGKCPLTRYHKMEEIVEQIKTNPKSLNNEAWIKVQHMFVLHTKTSDSFETVADVRELHQGMQ